MKKYFLQIKDVILETADTITIEFWHPASEQIKYKSGQFLTLVIPDSSGRKIKRSYSMSSSPISDSSVAIAVKRKKGGYVSNYLFQNAKAGNFLEVYEPMGTFTFEPEIDNSGHLVLIAAGSGITPIISILKTSLKANPDRKILLIYGNRDEENIIFKDDLNILEEKFPETLKIVYTLSRPSENWDGEKGRITNEKCDWIFEEHGVNFKEDLFFMCGPEAMMEDVKKSLSQFKVPKEHISYERFNAPTIIDDEDDEEGLKKQTVTVHFEGETYVYDVEPHQTILSVGLDLDIDLPYSCQAGMCTACMGRLIKGKVKMDEDEGLTDEEKEEGYILTCVGHPLTGDVEIEIE